MAKRPGTFDLNERAVGDILNGAGMARDMERRTAAIAAAAGEGMEASVQQGRVRIQASVITATPKARSRERRRRVLERAVDAGR